MSGDQPPPRIRIFLPLMVKTRRLLRVHFGCDFANAELGFGVIGLFAVDLELHVSAYRVRRAHLRRPPQARIGEFSWENLLGLEGHVFALVRRQFHILREFDLLDLAL